MIRVVAPSERHCSIGLAQLALDSPVGQIERHANDRHARGDIAILAALRVTYELGAVCRFLVGSNFRQPL